MISNNDILEKKENISNHSDYQKFSSRVYWSTSKVIVFSLFKTVHAHLFVFYSRWQIYKGAK